MNHKLVVPAALTLALTLACGGAPEAPVVSEESAPESAPEPEPEPEPAPEVALPPDANPQYFAYFQPKGGGCALMEKNAHRIETEGKVLAWYEGDCPSNEAFLVSGEGDQLAVTDPRGGWAAVLNLGDQHGYLLPHLDGLELVGFQGGKPMALSAAWAHTEEDESTGDTWLVSGDQRVPADPDDEAWAMEYVICTLSERDGDGWRTVEATGTGIGEGMGQPFCQGETEQGASLGEDAVPIAFTGGHGFFVDPVSDPEGLPAGTEDSEWYQGPDERYALRAQWLEGYSLSTPLYFHAEQGWRPVKGLEEPNQALSLAAAEGYLIACNSTHRGVFSMDTAEPLWWTEGSCAVWWPPES